MCSISHPPTLRSICHLIFAFFLLLNPYLEGKAATLLDYLNVVRYTYVGPGSSTNDGQDIFTFEVGKLDCKAGFVASSTSEVPMSGDTAREFKTVSGKFLADYGYYGIYANSYDMSCFPRSADTFLVDNRPTVAIGYLPVVSIKATQTNAAEAGPIAGEFLISLNGASSTAVTVRYAISGTAKKRKDFKKISETVKIPAGNVSSVISVIPVDDRQPEKSEEVSLTLRPTNQVTLGANTATVTIEDND